MKYRRKNKNKIMNSRKRDSIGSIIEIKCILKEMMRDDEKGEFMFIGPRGNSMINYLL